MIKEYVPNTLNEFLNEAEAKPNFAAKSKESLKSTFPKIQEIKAKLKKAGYAPTHRSFKTLDEAFKIYKEKGVALSNKMKFIELKFDFDANWYDQRTKASLTGYVGVKKREMIDMFKEQYNEQLKKYRYGFSVDGFCAEKLKELCDKTGVKVAGGGSSYAQNNGNIFLYIAGGELN